MRTKLDAAEAAPYDAASLWSRLTYRYALAAV